MIRKMEVYYNIRLNENLNDLEKINALNSKTKNVYLISKLEYDFEHHIKLKDIKELKIDNTEPLVFAFDCSNLFNEKNKIFRQIKHIKRHKKEIFNNSFQVIVFNYQQDYEIDILDLIKSIKIVLLITKFEKIDYIYDTVCDYLDNDFSCKNICEFKNDKCIAKMDFNLTCGCCRHYKNLFSNKFVQCEYLVNKRCSTKCLPCKMFTCHYIVKNKKIKYRIQDIFLLQKFFNPIQKLIILVSFFTPKETIMKKLLKC